MNEKRHEPEGDRFGGQCLDRYHPFAADLSSAGMGSWEDFQRYLVLPLQSRFQKEMHRDDSGGHDAGAARQSPLRHTLHTQLFDYVLELAGAIGFGLTQLARFTNTMRHLHR